MALEGNRQLLWGDAPAVVFHGDQAHTTGEQAHRDVGGTRVQRVVEQLAQHRCRAFNHLASGDLADQFIGEFADGSRCERSICHRGILGLWQAR